MSGRIFEFFSRLLGFFRRTGNSAAELDEEIRNHLEMLEQDNLQRGMTPSAARLAARHSFGGVEQSREIWRDQRSLPPASGVRRQFARSSVCKFQTGAPT